MSEIIIGMKNGLTRSGPRSLSTRCWASNVSMPPIPEPRTTPIRSRSSESTSIPELWSASRLATTANWTKRSIRLASLRSITPSVVKSFTSQANRVVKEDASKRVIGPAPDFPAIRFFQNSSVMFPSGETTPVPVTNTRRPFSDMGYPSPGLGTLRARRVRSSGLDRKDRCGGARPGAHDCAVA